MSSRGPRLSAALAAGIMLLAACSQQAAPSPPASPTPDPTAQLPELLTARYEVGPVPGPVKPFRGEMVQEVQVYKGWVTMRFRLINVGEEPITFLNTLYDYEPRQVYEPIVRLGWTDGTAAAYTRRGRFFPTPAMIQPGGEAVYLLGAQPIREAGSGKIGELLTHIKYCPVRGMDDEQSLPLEVSDLEWESAEGVTSVRGVLHETRDEQRSSKPRIGVEFLDAEGQFLGAVVEEGVGDAMAAGGTQAFEISGPGVRTDAVAEVRAFAWVR